MDTHLLSYTPLRMKSVVTLHVLTLSLPKANLTETRLLICQTPPRCDHSLKPRVRSNDKVFFLLMVKRTGNTTFLP